jgi:hypothetical protein
MNAECRLRRTGSSNQISKGTIFRKKHIGPLTRAWSHRDARGGGEPGIQVARMETLPVPFVTLLATVRPRKVDARAVIGV